MNRPYYKRQRCYGYKPQRTENAWPGIIAITACCAAWMVLLMIIAFT